MKRGFRCRREILEHLKNKYEQLVVHRYENDYLEAVRDFDFLVEENLRPLLRQYYPNQRSRDQAWKSCKGALYEYAIFKYIEKLVNENPNLQNRFLVLMGDSLSDNHRNQVVIRNWSEIFPDVDILIVERESDLVKAIISCKTSLRERLTETAFWKRELEQRETQANIKIIFITTDKDRELKSDTNRYILLHVIDYTFVTDSDNFRELIEYYERRYGQQIDFNQLLRKVRFIDTIQELLREL